MIIRNYVKNITYKRLSYFLSWTHPAHSQHTFHSTKSVIYWELSEKPKWLKTT